jgi:hypothetical protein
MCDRCGIRHKLLDLREETIRGRKKNNRVCPVCWEPDHPQNFLDKAVTVDPQALEHARPDTGLWSSRRMFPFNMWLGHPAHIPDLEVQEKLLVDQQIKNSDQRILSDWEQRRFRWSRGER